MNYLKIKSEIQARTCPVHNVRPSVRLEAGRITLRCCCDRFTSVCMSDLDKKLNQHKSLLSIIDAWEQDLFYNEMQLR